MNKRPIIVSIVPLIVGAWAVYHVANKPGFEAYRSVDVVTLVASGMCFGVVLLLVLRGFMSGGKAH
jgi:hypothetical protein